MHKLAIFFLVIAVLPLLILAVNKKKATFTSTVSECSKTATNLRFSCYRGTIEKYYRGDLKGFTAELKKEHDLSFEAYDSQVNVSYAIFGTNCHTFYHAAGDFVATYSDEDVKTILSYGPSTCTNGYTMGVYKRIALKNHFSTDTLKEFYRVCKKGAENQCAHEIGHNLHDKYSYSILKILDGITTSQYHVSYPQKYDYVTFQSSTQADLNKPFEECKALMPDKNKLAQCFTGIGHNLFLYSEFSKDGYKSMFSECSKTNQENKSNCYGFMIYRIGINEVATKFLSHEFSQGRKICDGVVAQVGGQADFKEHCYKGLGGGIGLFIDSEYALTDINEKNLATVKKQLIEYLKLCEESEGKFVNSCFAGLFGTKFAKFYDLLRIDYKKIDELRPFWSSDFEVVG